MRRTRLLLAAVFVLSSGDGLAQTPADGGAARGRQIFVTHGCYQCHGYQGQGSNAGSRLSPNPVPLQAFAILVRQPRARMPPYSARILSDQDLSDIHAYLMTIPKARPVADIPLLKE